MVVTEEELRILLIGLWVRNSFGFEIRKMRSESVLARATTILIDSYRPRENCQQKRQQSALGELGLVLGEFAWVASENGQFSREFRPN